VDLIVIPQALLVFYGFLVLGCGSGLGFILARNVRRLIDEPDPPRLLERRVDVLERELEVTQSELGRLAEENTFLRELRTPNPDSSEPGLEKRLFIA
jgi:hypothetical protein